jgi:hypothetical protein
MGNASTKPRKIDTCIRVSLRYYITALGTDSTNLVTMPNNPNYYYEYTITDYVGSSANTVQIASIESDLTGSCDIHISHTTQEQRSRLFTAPRRFTSDSDLSLNERPITVVQKPHAIGTRGYYVNPPRNESYIHYQQRFLVVNEPMLYNYSNKLYLQYKHEQLSNVEGLSIVLTHRLTKTRYTYFISSKTLITSFDKVNMSNRFAVLNIEQLK